MDAFDTRLCFFGHTHQPVVFSEGVGRQTIDTGPGLPGTTVPLARARRALVNPGSVGQPRDGLRDAAYGILELGGGGGKDGAFEFRRVRYEVERTQDLMRDVGLPMRLVERLSYGR
jgi:diadenosine tetraphosphatase ApaH/serine/threonine PP2A family protein phosphatase